MTSNLSSLVLYGSASRGDSHGHSDVDLLGICQKSTIHKNIVNNFNICVYENETLLNWSRQGNLFVYHLVKEGRVIYDPIWTFKNICDIFILKSNYTEEKMLGKIIFNETLANGDKLINWMYRNNLIIWALRTICSACGAENKIPVYSPLAIAKLTNSNKIEKLIKGRTNGPFTESEIKVVQGYIELLTNGLQIDANYLGLDSRKYLDRVRANVRSNKRQVNYV